MQLRVALLREDVTTSSPFRGRVGLEMFPEQVLLGIEHICVGFLVGGRVACHRDVLEVAVAHGARLHVV